MESLEILLRWLYQQGSAGRDAAASRGSALSIEIK